MQSFLTFAFETVSVSAFAFFAIAFVTGFVIYTEQAAATVPDIDLDMTQVLAEFDQYHQPANQPAAALDWGKVVSFSRPYRRPVCVAIDWSIWSSDDLKRASQRKPSDIPLRIGKKKLSKAQLVERYTAALGLATAAA